MFKPFFLMLITLSACSPGTQPTTFLTLNLDGRDLNLSYTPGKPQVGDTVILTLKSKTPDPLPPSISALGSSIRTWDQGRSGTFKILIKKPGPFQPSGFPSALWTVPDTGDLNWVDLPEVLPNKQDWTQLLITLGALGFASFLGLWFFFWRRPRAVDPKLVLIRTLENWVKNLPESDLKPVYRTLRDHNLLKTPESKVRMSKALYSTGANDLEGTLQDLNAALKKLREAPDV